MTETNWVCYIVYCSDASLYTGITNDLKARIKAHNEGRGSKYTRSRLPVRLVANSCGLTRSQAQKLEAFIKTLPSLLKMAALQRYREEL